MRKRTYKDGDIITWMGKIYIVRSSVYLETVGETHPKPFTKDIPHWHYLGTEKNNPEILAQERNRQENVEIALSRDRFYDMFFPDIPREDAKKMVTNRIKESYKK